MLPQNLMACPDCDMLQRLPALPPRAMVNGLRCGCTLAVDKPDSLERTLCLTVAAAIVFVIANVTPVMGLALSGRTAPPPGRRTFAR
jgi:paraquat-inducible protein A